MERKFCLKTFEEELRQNKRFQILFSYVKGLVPYITKESTKVVLIDLFETTFDDKKLCDYKEYRITLEKMVEELYENYN